MDIDAAIEMHRTALLRLLTVMFTVVGIEEGGSVGVVRERVRLMVLRVLGAADSATRRLIFLKARSMPDVEHTPRPAPDKAIPRGKGSKKSRPFPLFDPRKKRGKRGKKHAPGPGPRILFFDERDARYPAEPEKTPVSPDDLVSAESLCQRLNAVFGALGNLEKQAKRLKRAQARRKRSKRLSLRGVLRIHTPPGHREKGRSENEREVDLILAECQTLARRWIAAQDTS